MSSDQTAKVVVAAVIVQDGKVLLSQKKESHNPENVGKWEFPGGKVRLGESFVDALRREVKEELNVEIRIGRLLHSQINTYSDCVDYLVLYYACTLFGTAEYFPEASVRFLPISTFPEEKMSVVGHEASVEYLVLPGTVEAVSKLDEQRDVFSFVQSDVTDQTLDETLHMMTYELGKVVEYYHKSKRYGATGYYSDENQMKEMSDLISACRMYCEQKGWDYDTLMKFGEKAYLDRMEDLRKHGK